MNNILEKIAFNKRIEIEHMKIELPQAVLLKKIISNNIFKFREALSEHDKINIIAEIKKGSPSKGIISTDFNPGLIAQKFKEGGASAISVLTDEKYFYGRHEYLAIAKKMSGLPVLCKDFIIDKYQIYYASFMKADAILLIVRMLTDIAIKEFINIAHEIGLDCLVETHTEEEVKRAVACGADIIGVNNRDLSDFSVNLEKSEKLAKLIPDNVLKVTESGIHSYEDIQRLQKHGYAVFLVGESLMASDDAVAQLKALRGL